jgi:hypothetical protein
LVSDEEKKGLKQRYLTSQTERSPEAAGGRSWKQLKIPFLFSFNSLILQARMIFVVVILLLLNCNRYSSVEGVWLFLNVPYFLHTFLH